jgi:hypothetical protein
MAEQASIQWAERIPADEPARLEQAAKLFAEMQARKSARNGAGRALHRKQITGAVGRLEVLDSLPEFARHGLFAQPGEHEVWVRLSNGGMDRAPDRMPDIRGFALRVLGVKGDSALGHAPAVSQDFTLINHEAFAFSGSAEFIDFVLAASHGNGALLKFLLMRYGWIGGPRMLGRFLKLAGKSFTGFANEMVYSAVPMACGPYAVRVRLVPGAGNGAPLTGARENWGSDVAARLLKGPLDWDLQLQPFVDERTTPIEDASVNWPTSYTTVARLTLPVQDLASEAGRAAAEKIEASVFDPWQALAAHRPLGDVQRARKVIYFQSQKGRGAA